MDPNARIPPWRARASRTAAFFGISYKTMTENIDEIRTGLTFRFAAMATIFALIGLRASKVRRGGA